jgi:fatty acyl-ACP thioesterase B
LIYLAKLLGWQKTFVASVQNDHISKEQIRQNIPTKKQLVDYHRQGLIIKEGVGYRQTVVIRSYEVGSDKLLRSRASVIFSR